MPDLLNMRVLNLSFVLCVALLNMAITVSAQTYQENVVYGDESYAEGDFYSASVYFNNALMMDSSNVDVVWKCAETNRLFNNYGTAAHWYSFIRYNDRQNKYPQALFWNAMMEKSQGNYATALEYFESYCSIHKSDDDVILKRAKLEVEACKKAPEIIENKLNVSIDHLLDASVNTSWSEFNGFQLGDSMLVFSALRPISISDYESFLPDAYNAKIYTATNTSVGWSDVADFSDRINDKESHNANICFTDDHSGIYFSRGKVDNNPQLKCDIWHSENQGGDWSKPVKLNDKVNLSGYTNTQPYYVEGADFDVLYFVSDRPGGYGRLDIWYVVVKDGKYQEPVNLGSNINTPADEISPFYYDSTSTLYFSSDWHEGLGGFDIFYSPGGLNTWTKPANIGYPINTPYNDVYFNINEVDKDGYFTSNRPGSLFIKSETCCNDIYYYEWGDTTKVKQLVVIEDTQDTINIEESVKMLLPLTLYFHNDEPDPNTMNDFTKKNYKETLSSYYAMKSLYKQEYSKGLPGNDKLKAERDIEDFFEDYLARGFTHLKLFSHLLLLDLEKGSQVQIKIKGYCSPLTTTEYNFNLAKRRIGSLKNYLFQYDEGVFLPYFNGTAANGGKLIIFEDPLGESTASSFVSDNPNDKRNSIYSRAAAFERKIQIIMYESDQIKDSVTLYPALLFDHTMHDFGTVEEGQKMNCVFSFENTGDSDLSITSIETSCGCTVADWPKERIPPGGEAYIGIIFNAEDLGSITQTVTILSNTESGKDILFINANVIEPAH